MHIHVYIYIYTHTCISHIHACISLSLSTYIYICIYVCIYLYIHICIYVYVCVYIYVYTHTYTENVLAQRPLVTHSYILAISRLQCVDLSLSIYMDTIIYVCTVYTIVHTLHLYVIIMITYLPYSNPL